MAEFVTPPELEQEIRALSDKELEDTIHRCRVSGSKRGGHRRDLLEERLLLALHAEQARRASAWT